MLKVNLEQGSQEWLQWRKKLLTATDAAILLGKSPYVTPFQGWQRKCGLIPEQKTTAAMERGHRDEPIARALFIQEYGINMTPCCIESENYNFIGASLDGLSDCEQYILEVKSQRPVDQVPELHMIQMQHQMLCTDWKSKKAFYVSHWEGVNKVFEIDFDLKWTMDYITEAKEFWGRVVFNDPPPLTNRDYKDMSGAEKWIPYSKEYVRICNEIKLLEELKDSYRKELIKMCNDESCSGGGIKVLKKIVKGRIDYDSVPQLTSLDLEPYRKPSSASWVITSS